MVVPTHGNTASQVADLNIRSQPRTTVGGQVQPHHVHRNRVFSGQHLRAAVADGVRGVGVDPQLHIFARKHSGRPLGAQLLRMGDDTHARQQSRQPGGIRVVSQRWKGHQLTVQVDDDRVPVSVWVGVEILQEQPQGRLLGHVQELVGRRYALSDSRLDLGPSPPCPGSPAPVQRPLAG